MNAATVRDDARDDARDDRALAALYDRIAAQGRSALIDGVVEPDPLPSDDGERWGISVVFRPRPWSTPLTQHADALAALLGPTHVVYRPDAFHVTVQQFEGYRARVGDDDGRVRAYRAAMASLHGQVRLRLCGLVASPTGVLVQGWPLDGLQRWRRALHDRLAATGLPVQGPESDRDRVRTSAHASLAVFGGPVAQGPDVAAFVDRHRTTDFGTWTFDTAWLVGYRRTSTDIALIEYAMHRLDA